MQELTTEDWLFIAGIGCLTVAALWMFSSFVYSLWTTRVELVDSEKHDRRVMQQKIRECIYRDIEGDPEAEGELPGLLFVYRAS